MPWLDDELLGFGRSSWPSNALSGLARFRGHNVSTAFWFQLVFVTLCCSPALLCVARSVFVLCAIASSFSHLAILL